MNNQKIVFIEELDGVTATIQGKNQKIVLIGGCFDILHIGHIDFIKKARKLGDVLIVLLESDATLRRLKGSDRPIHTQSDRSVILAALEAVDFVVRLPSMNDDAAYDSVISKIKPAIIATTIGDSFRTHKDRQAKSVSARVVEISKISNQSTSKVAKLLEKEI